MLKNYIKVALRNLWKDKSFSSINLMGLAIGMATGVLILNYVGFESSYDQFHQHKDQVYRMIHDKYVGGEKLYSKAQVYLAMGPAVEQNFSQVEAYTRLFKMAEELEMSVKVVREDGQSLKFKESDIYMASKDFFKVFSFDLLQGDPSTVLEEPKQVVISQTTAQKYFGEKIQLIGSYKQVFGVST